MEYGASSSDKTGYRVGKPLIFATGINRIRSNLGSVAEWSRAPVLLSGGPGFKASPLLLVGFVILLSVVPSPNARSRFVNNQLVCLLTVNGA